MTGERDVTLRREAMQVAIQLPTDPAEALQVLEYAEQLVRGYFAGRAPIKSVAPLKLV